MYRGQAFAHYMVTYEQWPMDMVFSSQNGTETIFEIGSLKFRPMSDIAIPEY